MPTYRIEDGLPIKRNPRLPEDRLERRRFEAHLTHVPFSYLSLRRGDYDVAHALHVTDALAANRWAMQAGKPSILSYMGIPDHPGLTDRRLRLQLTLRAVAGCDAVVALSRGAADAFHRWLGVDAKVIHPGVDLDAFQPGGQRASAPTVFCGAAIDEPRKRVSLLIAACRIARREQPELRLRLSRPRDHAVVESLGARDPWIEFVDVDDRADLARAYREAWVSALPSFGEAFGLVLVESLACGTPVVASNLGGMREVVNEDAIGRLFDEGEEALARSILETMELVDERATPAACRSRAEAFSTERCADAYIQLYRELSEER